MKRVLANVPIVFLLGIAACGDNQITSSGFVEINDLRNTHMQVPDVVDKKNLANHKYHDVEVYKTIHVEESDSEGAYEVFFIGMRTIRLNVIKQHGVQMRTWIKQHTNGKMIR